MDAPQLVEARFFSVAKKKGRMKRADCARVFLLQQERREMGLEPPKCGQLAVDLGILSEAEHFETLQDLKQAVADRKRLPDPIEHLAVFPSTKARARHDKVIMWVLVLVVFAVGAVTRSPAYFFGTASFASFVRLAQTTLAPHGLRGRIRWDRVARLLVFILAGASLTYCTYVSYVMYLFAQVRAPTNPILTAGSVVWTRFFVATSILVVVALYSVGLNLFRRQEIKDLTNRIELTRGLVQTVYEEVGRSHSGNAGKLSRSSLTDQILRTTGDVLRLNPWDRVLSFVLASKRPVGAPCLWYLEPCATPAEGFEIKRFVVPGATRETVDVFKRIKKEHRPRRLDRTRFEKEIENCSTGGEFDREKFLAIPDREDFVSLTGFVYEYGRGILSGDVDTCIVMQRSYISRLRTSPLPAATQHHLQFTSVAAYPVVAASNSKTIGVLIAFKNVRNGILKQDSSALVQAARLLGICLS